MNVLEKIVVDKKDELVTRKQGQPLDSFVAQLTPSTKSLFDALNTPEAGFVLECKKASPSKGLIRARFDLDEILSAYLPYAAAISVLTDEKYFQGKYEYLEYVTERATQPVLNKDFFVDEYQVHLARYYHADAILLMLSVLDDQQYQALAKLAEHYQLDVLTEVSNEEEARRAVALGARIIGINNRNLRDLSTDLATTEQLVPLLNSLLNYDAVIISESGIYSHQDVRRLAPLVQGFLVGSSLMAESDLPQAVQQLLLGKVKVCGLTRAEDAAQAKTLGATYGGLIFASQSKRCLTKTQARAVMTGAPLQYVGVFVDQPITTITEIATELQLAAVQLHGREDDAFISTLRDVLPDNIQIWKAKGVSEQLPPCNEKEVDLFLLDCKVGAQTGGTGQQFDWQLLQMLTEKNRFALAGGIKPDNIAQAASHGLALIDINSGVESAPGQKDHQKLQQAFVQLRNY